MTATNHAITGATIGLLITAPVVVIPLAIASHFVCDIIPHFGANGDDNLWIKSKAFKAMLIVDALACLVLVGIIIGLRPNHWLLACVCAFAATSPDLLWLNRFIRNQLGKSWKPSLISKFAGSIQWFQRPIGAIVEATWAISGIIVLSIIIR